MKDKATDINGLHFENRYRNPNGGDSYVIYYPTIQPFSLVYHGDEKFEYKHFGIHLGQKDRLTFLGNPNQKIIGHFIDCRKESDTFKEKVTTDFNWYLILRSLFIIFDQVSLLLRLNLIPKQKNRNHSKE